MSEFLAVVFLIHFRGKYEYFNINALFASVVDRFNTNYPSIEYEILFVRWA